MEELVKKKISTLDRIFLINSFLRDLRYFDEIIETTYIENKKEFDFWEYDKCNYEKGSCLDFYYFFGLKDLVIDFVEKYKLECFVEGLEINNYFSDFWKENRNKVFTTICLNSYNLYYLQDRNNKLFFSENNKNGLEFKTCNFHGTYNYMFLPKFYGYKNCSIFVKDICNNDKNAILFYVDLAKKFETLLKKCLCEIQEDIFWDC